MLLKMISRRKQSDSVTENASNWVARRDSEAFSKEDARVFAQWKNARPEHQTEYDDLERVWDDMGSLSGLLGDDLRKQQPDPDILSKRFGKIARPDRDYSLALKIAASLLIVVGAAWLLSGLPESQNVYTTDVGEVRTIVLTDGSRVILNTDTRLSVNFDDNLRQIDLKAGEAYFKVASNPDRPFVVHAGRGEIIAVGTEFNVHREDEAVEVVVAEGIVEVAMPSEGHKSVDREGEQIFLTENQGAKYNGHLSQAASINPDELKRGLSWQEKKLEFDNEPLSRVVKEIERYTNKRIFISSSELESLRIGGVYETGDVDQLVDALQDLFPIRAVKVTPYFTILVATGAEG